MSFTPTLFGEPESGAAAATIPRPPRRRKKRRAWVGPTLLDIRWRFRVRRHACDYQYVRKVGGRKYQARLWVGGRLDGHSVNLGLYDTDAEAYRAVRRVLSRLCAPGTPSPLDIWAAMKPLIEEGVLPAHLLPKYAHRRPDGLFGGRVRKGGELVAVGPFADPAEATAAILEILGGR